MRAETLKDRVVRRMTELAGSPESPWTAIETNVGATIRRTWQEATPDWARPHYWPEESYQAHVFLTLVAGTFILGRAASPWTGRQDSNVPLWLVEAILEDPELGLDSERQMAMRHARRGGRSGDGVRR